MKKTSAKKASKKSACTDPVCNLMTGPKGRAFGKAGESFYKEYLKLAKKGKNKVAIKELTAAVAEMGEMSKGKICACTGGGDCGCC